MPVQLTTIGSGNRTTSAADAKVFWVSATAPVSSVRSFARKIGGSTRRVWYPYPFLVQMLEGQMVVFRRRRDDVDRHLA